MIDKAYVTILTTENYLEAVLVLNQSLKLVNSKYPLIVYTTKEIIKNNKIFEVLKKENIIIETNMQEYYYSQKTLDIIKKETSDYRYNTLKNTALKIGILELQKYEKLCYIDADSIVLSNIDDIFNFPSSSMLWDGTQGLSALMVFEPKRYPVACYKILLENDILTDGALFSMFWNNCEFDNNYKIPINFCGLSENTYNLNSKVIKAITFGEFRENKLWFYKTKDLLNSNSLLRQKYGIILNQLRNEYNNFDFIKKENYF